MIVTESPDTLGEILRRQHSIILGSLFFNKMSEA